MSGVTLLHKWRLLQAILADHELSPSAKLVAVRLLYHHSSQTGRCSPSYQTLAEGAGLSRRTVIDGVRELKAWSWVPAARRKVMTSVVFDDAAGDEGVEGAVLLLGDRRCQRAALQDEVDVPRSASCRHRHGRCIFRSGRRAWHDQS